MSKIITRLIVIGLIVSGAWHLWSHNNDQNILIEEISGTESTTSESKEEGNLVFKINKDENNVAKEIKKEEINKTKKETQNTQEEAGKTVKIITNTDKELFFLEKATPEKTLINLTPNIAKFVEGEAETAVSVYFYEYNIDVSSNEIPAGNVVFRAMNNGRLSHELTLKDGNGQVVFGRIAPGETKYFQTNLATSTLEIISNTRIDKENNMSKEIIVK